jgi:cytochrome c biogenesis protein
VTDGGKTVASKVIDVNHPLTYKGVSFYQSDFGLDRLSFKVTGPGGESRRIEFDVRMKDGPHGRQYTMTGASGDMPFEQISIGGRKLTVFAHNLAPDYVGGERVNATTMPLNPAALVMVNDRLPEYKGLDAWTKLGWIEEGKSARFKEYTISMEKAVDYTVLQVGRNPGLPLVYTGFGLMLFGVFVSFYVTRKVIRVRVSPTEDGSSALIGANSRSEPSVFDADFDRLREVLN